MRLASEGDLIRIIGGISKQDIKKSSLKIGAREVIEIIGIAIGITLIAGLSIGLAMRNDNPKMILPNGAGIIEQHANGTFWVNNVEGVFIEKSDYDSLKVDSKKLTDILTQNASTIIEIPIL